MGRGVSNEGAGLAQAGSAGRMRAASDPATGWLTLHGLAAVSWFSRPLARALAGNPRLPRSLLWLGAVRRWDVRATLAANPRCPRLLLQVMAHSSDWAVCAAVAASAAASPRLLARLIRREPPCVRLYAAVNSSLTQGLADRLVTDPDPYVRGAAAAHPAASAEALRQLADGLSEPAWVLRGIAANPSCPAELSDQLLTWIALGGPGHADPEFDPVACTGHPGDTRVALPTWYLEQARRHGARQHALWRVRAMVMQAAGRLSPARASELARDPRPEVRRVIAGLFQLPLDIRLELRRDADSMVVRLATAALHRGKNASPEGWRLRRVIPVVAPALIVGGLIGSLTLLQDGSLLGQPPPGLLTGSGPPSPNPSIFSTRTLPAGGSLTCGLLLGSGGSTSPLASVTAGGRGVTLHMSRAVTAVGGPVGQERDMTVPARGEARFILPSGPPVTVTAIPDGGSPKAVMTLSGCG